MPPIFSSKRIDPTARSMPKFVPIPSSPRRRAPSSVASIACSTSSPRSARAAVDAAVAELELDARDLDAARAGGHVEPDRALGRGLERPGEDLAGGHVAPAVGVDPGAAGDRQREVGALGLDPDLARAREALDQAAPARRAARPRRRPGRRGRGTAPAHERREVVGRHARLLGAGRRRPQRGAPAPRQHRLADRRAGARGARHPGRVDAGQIARVRRRRRSAATRRSPRPPPARPARSRRGARRAPPPRTPASCSGSATRSSGHASRSSSARWSASRSGSASVVERTTTCWPGATSRQ